MEVLYLDFWKKGHRKLHERLLEEKSNGFVRDLLDSCGWVVGAVWELPQQEVSNMLENL